MKKKIFMGIAVLAIAALSAWNIQFTSKSGELSDLSLANIETLATPENFDCMAYNHCGINCPYEWCGYCMGFYLLECPQL
jgi:hypothetical protein